MNFISRTHPGQMVKINEDRLLIRTLADEHVLLLVADGLGGNPGGEVAASLVSKYIEQLPIDRITGNLENLLIESSDLIKRHGSDHPLIDGMGSTGTLVLIEKEVIKWAHVGDSRLYLYSNNELQSITRDQTLARQMYDLGDITLEEVRGHRLNHVLEQCLGEDDIEPDSGEFTWNQEDILLLSTDGLHDMVDNDQIHAILADSSLTEKADTLLEKALHAGGKDNISFILGHHVNH